MQKGLLIYLIVMNLIGLAVMAMDKSKARHHAWRIPEKTLFLVSILGGSAERGPACICFIIRQSTGILWWECHLF